MIARAPDFQHVGEWLSLVEHLVRDQGVGGSNPLSPTNFISSHLRKIAEVSPRAFLRSNSHCAQNCAHSADPAQPELHLRLDGRTALTSRRNYVQRFVQVSKHHSPIPRVLSESVTQAVKNEWANAAQRQCFLVLLL